MTQEFIRQLNVATEDYASKIIKQFMFGTGGYSPRDGFKVGAEFGYSVARTELLDTPGGKRLYSAMNLIENLQQELSIARQDRDSWKTAHQIAKSGIDKELERLVNELEETEKHRQISCSDLFKAREMCEKLAETLKTLNIQAIVNGQEGHEQVTDLINRVLSEYVETQKK